MKKTLGGRQKQFHLSTRKKCLATAKTFLIVLDGKDACRLLGIVSSFYVEKMPSCR
jgi:hypothetical protein